jgi:hypothetical protein
MIDATTHTRKIWRSHFDGADSTIRIDPSVPSLSIWSRAATALASQSVLKIII